MRFVVSTNGTVRSVPRLYALLLLNSAGLTYFVAQTQASGVPFEALKPLITGAVREFMLLNYLHPPFHDGLQHNPPSLRVPTDLFLPHLLGRPVERQATETASKRNRSF